MKLWIAIADTPCRGQCAHTVMAQTSSGNFIPLVAERAEDLHGLIEDVKKAKGLTPMDIMIYEFTAQEGKEVFSTKAPTQKFDA